MNVVHLQLSGGTGGISVLTKDIAEKSKNNNIFYFLFEGGIVADKMKEMGCKVVVKNGSHANFIGEGIKLVKFCKENNADVLIAHSGAPIIRYIATFAKKHLKNIKMFVYLHSSIGIVNYKNKIKNALSDYIDITSFNHCDKAIAISNSVKESYQKKYNLKNGIIQTVYNGINTEKFKPNYNKSGDAFNIYYVGRVIKYKGVHNLISAAGTLNLPNINIMIVGKCYNGYDKELKELAKKNGIENQVYLCGEKTDVENQLKNAHLFVHPAKINEGFGLTLAEALSCAVPCIAYNEGAMTEIIENGKNGFIANDFTISALAEAIKKVYDIWSGNYNSYIEMCRYSNASAQKFSIEKTVKELESLY